MRVYCPSRKEVLETAAEPLAPPGAEGSVFLLPSVPGMVAKIFDAPSADNRRAKVETLISHPFYDPPAADGHRRFPAPQEILLDRATGEFVGHTMHLIPNADALDEFFDPLGKRYRGQLSFRVGLAISVAELLAEVSRHPLEITLGDLKPQNILADDIGRVALIDLDSVQMTTIRGTTYLCPVRSEYYTPPEVYGMDLRQQRREPSTDLFALAVVIFQLLFGGYHPFASANHPDHVGLIMAGRFPHVAGSPDRPPPEAPLFSGAPGRASAPFRPGFRGRPLGPGGTPYGRRLVRGPQAQCKSPGPPEGCGAGAGRRQGPGRRGAAVARGSSWRGGLRRRRSRCCRRARLFRCEVAQRATPRPEFAGSPMRDPGIAVTDDFRDPPRNPKARSEAPRYWRHLRDGNDGQLSFENADGTETRRQP